MDMKVLDGANFSGRTMQLREWVGLPVEQSGEVVSTDCAFVGPDPSSALSGLTHSVNAELDLVSRDEDAARAARNALEELRLQFVLDQNPFTLSGGEQVVVAVVAAVASRPRRLALDAALEQLAPELRNALLNWLATQEGELMIADNRLPEWYSGEALRLPDPDDPTVIDPTFCDALACEGPEIELVGLTFGYTRRRQVFNNLHLRLPAGRSFRLKGANGSGKTTLSKILCGLLKPSRGEIRVDGRVVRPWREPGALVSYHFQNPGLQLFATTIGGQLGMSPDPRSALDAIGIRDAVDVHPLDLPYVLQKRLALGNALLRKRGFLIADEPTLGQDDLASSSLSKVLERFGGIRISHSRKFDHLDSVML